MIPGRLPLTLYRGDTGRWRFSLWLDANKTQPTDLTGATALAQIRDRAGGSLIVSMECAITLPNHIDMVLLSADSARLPSSGAWDLQVTYASGDVITVLSGPVNTTSDVTTGVNVVTPLQLRSAR